MKEFVIIERANLALLLSRVESIIEDLPTSTYKLDLNRLSKIIKEEIKAQEEQKESKQKFKQIPLL